MNYLKLFESHILSKKYPGSEVLNIIDRDPMDVIIEYAPWYSEISEDQFIFRGLKSNSDYIIVDPSKNIRKPLGDNSSMSLYYDLIMNNSDEWINFSGDNLRKHSIFASTSEPETLKYGNVYRLIPLERSEEFIMASDSDTFSSFDYIKKRFGIGLMSFLHLMRSKLDLRKSYNTYDNMVKDINSTSDDKVDEFIRFLNKYNHNFKMDYDDRVSKEEINEIGSLSKWIDKMFSPELNGFSKVKYDNEIQFEGSGFRRKSIELWTGGKCLLVREGLLNGIGDTLDDKY